MAAVALMLLSPAFVAHPAHAQAAPQIELGFTPNYLLPLSQGSPVYSPGDEMWGISNYNASVTVLLAYPNGTSAAPPLRLEPQRLGQLYQFADSAPLGNWRISVVEQTSVVNATFPVTTQVASIQPALEASTLSGSLLVQNFTIPPTGAYDIQACALGENSSAELIGVVLPAGT